MTCVEMPSNTADLATRLHFESITINPNSVPAFENGTKILDIGAGKTDSYLLRQIRRKNVRKQLQVARLDYFGENLTKRPNGIVGNATQLPFASGSFKAVTSSEITKDNPYFRDSVHNRVAMGTEVSRVLEKGGYYLVYNEMDTIYIPPGFVKRAEKKGRESIGSGRTATGLLYGDYEKVADIIDTQGIGQEIATDEGTITDRYFRDLTAQYPIEMVFPSDIKEKILNFDQDSSTFTNLTFHMLGNFELEDELRKIIYRSCNSGHWETVTTKIDNAEDYLQDLMAGKLHLGVDEFDTAHKRERVLWRLSHSDYFNVFAAGNQVVTTPNQKLFDLLIEKVGELDHIKTDK